MDRNQELLEQYLSGTITPEDRAELEARALDDIRLGAYLDRQVILEKTLANSDSFTLRSGFESRVMAHLQQAEQDPWLELSNMLKSCFPRVAIPAVAFSALLMFNNFATATGDVAAVEAMFGIPDMSTSAEIAILGIAE